MARSSAACSALSCKAEVFRIGAQPYRFKSFQSQEKLMRYLLAALAAVLLLNLAACNTIRGMGQDIQRGGESIQHAASN